ncbi:MAG: YceI family protein [Polyangiales bacterium]
MFQRPIVLFPVVRRLLAGGLAVALLGLAAQALAAPTRKGKSTPTSKAQLWTIDGSHSSANFEVRHMMISNVQGTFADVTGEVRLDPKKLKQSSVQATIKVKSINTGDAKRDDHLRGKDFFDAKKFPTMTFRSTQVRKAGRGYAVKGELTIKGITKPVTLKVTEVTKPVQHPMLKVLARGARATTEIDRTDFGLTWNKNLDQGGLLIGEKVKITLDLELHQPRKS